MNVNFSRDFVSNYPKTLLVGLFFLVVGLLPMPFNYYTFNYYTFLKIIVCSLCVFLAYEKYHKSNNLWFVWGALALVFNPIIQIHFGSKLLWAFINLGVGVLFLAEYAIKTKIIHYNKKMKGFIMNKKHNKFALMVTIAMLLMASMLMSSGGASRFEGFFVILKVTVCGVAFWHAVVFYYGNGKNSFLSFFYSFLSFFYSFLSFLFIMIAILFNPILPILFHRTSDLSSKTDLTLIILTACVHFIAIRALNKVDT